MEIKENEIVDLIKHNKIKFKYGYLSPINSNRSLMTITFEGKISPKILFLFDTRAVGYTIINNVYVVQEVLMTSKMGKIEIFYGIFKDLIEIEELFNANINMLKIRELILTWQSFMIEEDNKIKDRILYMIDHIGVPEEYKQCKIPLYRGIGLSDLALKKLEKGKPIILQSRKFSSWSESEIQAIKFAGTKEKYSKGLLIKYSPTNEVLINVPLFFEKVFGNNSKIPLNKEKEVILINSDKMLTMFPKQLIFTKKIVRSVHQENKGTDKTERNYLKVKLKSKAILKAMEEDLELFSIEKVKKLVPKLVVAAQKIYNNWDEKDIDTYAGGGICHLIADEFCNVFWKHKIPCSTVSSSFEQHVYSIIQTLDGVFTVDIHPSVYETGSGFSWKKIKNVKFDKSDIYFYKLSSNPEEFDEYLGD